MRIVYHRQFRRSFRKRLLPYPSLVEKFEGRLRLLLEDPRSSELMNHKLLGHKKEFRAFAVTGDIRVVYRVESGTLQLLFSYMTSESIRRFTKSGGLIFMSDPIIP